MVTVTHETPTGELTAGAFCAALLAPRIVVRVHPMMASVRARMRSPPNRDDVSSTLCLKGNTHAVATSTDTENCCGGHGRQAVSGAKFHGGARRIPLPATRTPAFLGIATCPAARQRPQLWSV